MIVDALGRRFRNLRISLTAACNYACTYCVPDGKRLQAATHELDTDELVRAVQLLMDAAGIERLRITGGEPMLTPKFDAFLPAVMELGLQDVSVTTNGQFVLRKLDVLARSGLKRINVSLDTLDPDRFRHIARSGDLPTVLAGLEALVEAGIKVKINMVPMRTANADQILPMLDYCLERGFELRYIELMQMGHLRGSPAFQRDFLGMAEILEAIGSRYEFTRTDAPYDSTAVRYEIPGAGCFQRAFVRLSLLRRSARHQADSGASGAQCPGPASVGAGPCAPGQAARELHRRGHGDEVHRRLSPLRPR
jgi:cyclic pyranopterin phosphate synthase